MENAFTKIGSYQYSSEAIIVKGRLEAEGIEVFMADNFTIDTDPLVSNAIGGVKLFVETEQAEIAREILNTIPRYALDDNGQPVFCPKCKSDGVDLVTTVKDSKSFFAFLLTFLVGGGLPIYTKYKYRCSKCSHEFEVK